MIGVANQFVRQVWQKPFSDGGVMAVKSAVVGSAMFAGVNTLSTIVNSHFIQQIDASFSLSSIVFSLVWFFVVWLFGCLLALVPAYVMGALLVAYLRRKAQSNPITTRYASVVGGVFGFVAVAFVWLPIVLISMELVWSTGHGSVMAQVYRGAVASVIASLCGLYVGSKLAPSLTA